MVHGKEQIGTRIGMLKRTKTEFLSLKASKYLRNNLVFKALNNLAPNYIKSYVYNVQSDTHTVGTRNAKHNLILPKVRTRMAKNGHAHRF